MSPRLTTSRALAKSLWDLWSQSNSSRERTIDEGARWIRLAFDDAVERERTRCLLIVNHWDAMRGLWAGKPSDDDATYKHIHRLINERWEPPNLDAALSGGRSPQPDEPLRSRERAALDIALKALRQSRHDLIVAISACCELEPEEFNPENANVVHRLDRALADIAALVPDAVK